MARFSRFGSSRTSLILNASRFRVAVRLRPVNPLSTIKHSKIADALEPTRNRKSNVLDNVALLHIEGDTIINAQGTDGRVPRNADPH